MGVFLRFRPKPRRFARELITTNIDTTYLQPTLSVLFGKRNGAQLAAAAFHDTFKSGVTVAVANGSSVTIWTPAAGNVIQLGLLRITITNAGNYSLLLGATVIWQDTIPANVAVQVYNAWPGQFCYPIASVLTLQNNSGAASNLTWNAWGAEVLG